VRLLQEREREWQALPRAFVLSALLWVIVCEAASAWVQGMDTLQQLWLLRAVEGLGLVGLMMYFDLSKHIGLVKLDRRAWQCLLWLALLASVMGLIALAIFTSLRTWLALPDFVQGISGLLLMLIVAPMIEELLFRGVVYRLLREAFGVWLAIGLSALCFASMHGVMISPQLFGGLIFAWAYEYSRNLWVPIVLHIAGNSAIVGLVMLF